MRRVLIVLLIAVIVFLWGFYAFEANIRPLVAQMATSRAQNIASSVINNAVMEVMIREDIQYDNLVRLEKDQNGQITALKTNTALSNQLKSQITENILTRISDLDMSTISIPLGNIVNGELFSGRGPEIEVKIVPLGNVKADFKNEFTSSGINQTYHKIILETTVTIAILLPGKNASGQISTEVTIAETVIVGNVPDYFTYIAGDESGMLDKYNNYAPDYTP